MDSLPITLVVLAAGMGSRYGGLKQLDPVGPSGETLLDYSVYDAVRAGFSEIVFVIRKEIEELFRKKIGDRYQSAFPKVKIHFAFQELNDLPKKMELPSQRVKPWGTGHALWTARHLVCGPFMMINADDYYGPMAYQQLVGFLKQANATQYAMVGYPLKKTLSSHGSVSRGLCESTADGYLKFIFEQTGIQKKGDEMIAGNQKFTGEELASMNCCGFMPDLFVEVERAFLSFLENPNNDLTTAEFYLPSIINDLMESKKVSVTLFRVEENWVGLTHPSDLAEVKSALHEKMKAGIYPFQLF